MSSGLILGIDTSSSWGSLGLTDNAGLVSSRTLRVLEGHAKGLAVRIESLLSESGASAKDLTAIGVVNGPGSFTALRVGVSCAQGLGMGLDIPVVPVRTHDAIVESLPPMEGKVLVLVPARKGEVFAQTFMLKRGIGWEPGGVVSCRKLEEIWPLGEGATLVTGPALELYTKELTALFGSHTPLSPRSCRFSRGEVVADLARRALCDGSGPYPAERVGIMYLQSHGALTIEERERGKRDVRAENL
jgi:tRNA threonylcarbamoyladenosine biosynthesis protein TsaB